MSLLLVLSKFSAFGFPTCVFGALSITLSNSTDTVVGKINYSERWILRHIVYSDLNFSSASVRREGRGGGCYCMIPMTPSPEAFEQVSIC